MLNLPTNFKNDLAGRDTVLFPLVYIKIDEDTKIFLSTNQYSWFGWSEDTTFDIPLSTIPILLNIPSLKESIDIEKRNYKISSVNLDISNFPHEGTRFSELVGDSSLINTEVRIFWVSPSTDVYINVDNPANEYSTFEDAGHSPFFQVYFGTIRRYTHDDEKVRLVAEDHSQATLHKDLPLPNVDGEPDRWLGTGSDVPNKYKGKPIPMVYGSVDRSPCVISRAAPIGDESIIYGDVVIEADSSDKISLDADDPLFVSKGSTYVKVPSIHNDIYFPESDRNFYPSTQYIIDSQNKILLTSSYQGTSEDSTTGGNSISNNQILAYETIVPTTFIPLQVESSQSIGVLNYWYTTLLDPTWADAKRIHGTLFNEADAYDSWNGESLLDGTDIPEGLIPYAAASNASLVGCQIKVPITTGSNLKASVGYVRVHIKAGFYNKYHLTTGDTDTDVSIRVRFGGDKWGDYKAFDFTEESLTGTGNTWTEDGNQLNPLSDDSGYGDFDTHNSFSGSDPPITVENIETLLCYMRIDYGVNIMVGVIDFVDIEVDHWMQISDMLNQDYYANVNGRSDPIEAQTEGYWFITTFGNYADAEKITPPTVDGTNITDPLDVSFGVYEAGTFDIHQGYCTDGYYHYLSDAQSGWPQQAQCKIEKWNNNFTQKIAIIGDIRPTNGDDPIQVTNVTIGESVAWDGINQPANHPILSHCHSEANHIGDCDYYNGYILTGSGRWAGGIGLTDPYPQLVVIAASSMTVANVANLHAGEGGYNDDETHPAPGHTASAIAVDTVNNVWYLSSYTDLNGQGFVTGDRMAVYDLNTILNQKCDFIGWYDYINTIGGSSPDGDKIYNVQGLAYTAGHLYVTVNSGDIYVLEPDHNAQELHIIGYHEVGSGASHQGMNFYTDYYGNLKLGMLRDDSDSGNVKGATANIYFFPVNTETVEGEITYTVTYTESWGIIEKPSDIAFHLMDTELNGGALSEQVNYSGLPSIQISRLNHQGWQFGFTVSKKINSKKLLEELFASSKSFIRYNSMGEYGFVTIRNFSSWAEHDITIFNDDIISIKNSRTEIENVYTSIIVEYNKDYARDEYNGLLDPVNVTNLGFSDSFTDYYGFESDHSESEKTFSSDYIREEGTAKLWQEFLLNWYCNQHLLLFLDLPLKYMNIEVGDIVCFDRVTDVLPYGINYASQDFGSLQQINGQGVYPQFLVYETNKQIDKISIKCIQMHKIDYTVSITLAEDGIVFNLEDTIASTNYDDTRQIIKGLLK